MFDFVEQSHTAAGYNVKWLTNRERYIFIYIPSCKASVTATAPLPVLFDFNNFDLLVCICVYVQPEAQQYHGVLDQRVPLFQSEVSIRL